ncbi:MAG: hypothetical protein Q4G52_03005 [Clostridia bacterium]|nr:hypothetical protein [Clostridia bacterium]
MRALTLWLLSLALLALPAASLAGEGDPLLSVDDLLSLEESYEAFLSELEALAVERGLLSESERAAWHDAQLGDFYQNGGYGSILINYTPDYLSYAREEETLLLLSAQLSGGGRLDMVTMRRYTPQDSSLSGLMLTPSVTDASGLPVDAQYTFSADSGVFLKWDALLGAYVTVGATAVSAGESIVWSSQTPLPDAKNPVIAISIADARSGEAIAAAELTLTVDGEGYRLEDGALEGK